MRVVNVRQEPCTHYVGKGTMGPSGKTTGLGNPFAIATGRPRDVVISQYERWVRKQPELMQRIRELPEDAVLGCWCKPLGCHADVIVKIWKELHGKTYEDEGCPHYGEPHAH